MSQPRVIIVGGGFAGLAAAKALRSTPAKIILIDRLNHHLFQPLLYQVATSVLTPGQIGTPIRGILRKQKDTTVILGEVTGVDKARKCVFVSNADRQNVPVSYNYFIPGINEPGFTESGSRIHAFRLSGVFGAAPDAIVSRLIK